MTTVAQDALAIAGKNLDVGTRAWITQTGQSGTVTDRREHDGRDQWIIRLDNHNYEDAQLVAVPVDRDVLIPLPARAQGSEHLEALNLGELVWSGWEVWEKSGPDEFTNTGPEHAGEKSTIDAMLLTAAEAIRSEQHWCTHHRDIYDSGYHATEIPFGPARWDGSRARVEIEQHYGERVVWPNQDPGNPWRNGVPQATLHISNVDAETCRAAAAALLQAADLIEQVSR